MDYGNLKVPENVTPEVQAILDSYEARNKEIENVHKKNMAKLYGGAALQLGSAFIPGTLGLKAAGGAIKALTPYVGKKIAENVATGTISGLASGAVEGLGRGLMEGENTLKTMASDAILGTLFGGAFGLAGGKIGKKLAEKALSKGNIAPQKYFDDYVAGLAESDTLGKASPFSKEFMKFKGLRDSFAPVSKNTGSEFLFAGENALGADNVALNKAKEMFENGIDNEAIRKNTGWFKGVDNKWRYEIPDGELKETAQYDIVQDSLGLPLDEYHYKLTDLYDSPGLYKNYPQLTDTKIVFENMPEGFNGYAMPLDKEIHLNKDMARILNKKYVQRLEELEQTPEYKFYNENVYKNNGDYDLKVEEDFLNTPVGDEWGDLQWDNINELPKYINKGNDVKLKSKLTHELQHMIQDIENFAKGGSYKNPNYRNLAGEVEARMAAHRAFLKDEDRLKYSPINGHNIFYGYDTPAKEQIVDFSYGSSLYDKIIDNGLKYRNEWVKIGGKDYQILNLPKKDYGKILHVLDTNIKIDDNIGDVMTRYDDKYAYTFQKTSPTDYKFIKRVKLK